MAADFLVQFKKVCLGKVELVLGLNPVESKLEYQKGYQLSVMQRDQI